MRRFAAYFVLFVLLASAAAWLALPLAGSQPPPVAIAVSYPSPVDVPPPSFTATGTMKPGGAVLYGVIVGPDSVTHYHSVGTAGGSRWEIDFEDLPTGVPLTLYVFASDGITTVYQIVEFTCEED